MLLVFHKKVHSFQQCEHFFLHKSSTHGHPYDDVLGVHTFIWQIQVEREKKEEREREREREGEREGEREREREREGDDIAFKVFEPTAVFQNNNWIQYMGAKGCNQPWLLC